MPPFLMYMNMALHMIWELPGHLRKDSGVVFRCFLNDLEIIVFILLDWLPLRTWGPSLLCYLNNNSSCKAWINASVQWITTKVSKTYSARIWTYLADWISLPIYFTQCARNIHLKNLLPSCKFDTFTTLFEAQFL